MKNLTKIEKMIGFLERGIGICRSGTGHLREKLLAHEGHDPVRLRGNYVCARKKCRME